MKSSLSLSTLVVLAGSFASSVAQTAPSQPVDPTAQSPSTLAPTPPTFPSKQSDESNHSASVAKEPDKKSAKSFEGTVIKKGHSYVLKSADAEYLLEDHGEAKKYKGKRVKVTGTADGNHVLEVKMIELSPQM